MYMYTIVAETHISYQHAQSDVCLMITQALCDEEDAVPIFLAP